MIAAVTSIGRFIAPDLASPLPPLSRNQRAVFWALTVVCAASRLLARAKTLWDWDEALFCLGMRDYDVSMHHPHPPGFPLFIALAKVVRLATHDDFRALQSVALLCGALLFPAMFLLCRELRLPVTTSCVAGSLFVFFPNVWFFGGAAFSDVPSIALVTLSVGLLLRGCRSANAYLIGAFLLGAAASIRPQNLLLGIVPFSLATLYRMRSSIRDVLFAILLMVSVVAVAFGSAIYATGSTASYFDAVRAHGDYISRVDSFRNPERPPLWRLVDRFFFKQYQSAALGVVVSLLVLIGGASATRTRDKRMLLNVVTFGPFALLAWLTLDRYSISRFSIGYGPMFAILAAYGIARLAGNRWRVEATAGAVLVGAFVVWTMPALETVRRGDAPSYAAVDEVRRRIDPKRDQLFVTYSMVPFMEYLHPYLPFTRLRDDAALPLSAGENDVYALRETNGANPVGHVFRRQRGRLWNIARRHYFAVALEKVTRLPKFLEGWHAPEQGSGEEWRWMGGSAAVVLPPAEGPQRLRLVADVPYELLPLRPRARLTLNGQQIDEFVVTGARVDREWTVTAAPAGRENRLEIQIDRVLNPLREGRGPDPRDLGMQVHIIAWSKR